MPSQSSQSPRDDAASTLFQQIQQQGWFRRLSTRLQITEQLQAMFDRECPLELGGQCRVLGIHKITLIVEVANASLAMKLQYYTRELLVSLRKYSEFIALKKVQVRIASPSPLTQAKESPSPAPLSLETKKSLAALANHSSDPELKAALLRMIVG